MSITNWIMRISLMVFRVASSTGKLYLMTLDCPQERQVELMFPYNVSVIEHPFMVQWVIK